jgi:hypothetical protein
MMDGVAVGLGVLSAMKTGVASADLEQPRSRRLRLVKTAAFVREVGKGMDEFY